MPRFEKSLYWTPYIILSLGAMFMYIIGGRGRGKTYGCLTFCIKQFLKRKRKFIYLRRYDTEFSKKNRLLSAVSHEFPDFEMTVEGMKLLIRRSEDGAEWEEMGYLTPLSTGLSEKGIPYDDVYYIIFDEFITKPGSFLRYLPNEVELFLDYYNTVDRYNDRVRVFFLANSVSIVNPYFDYFRLRPRKGCGRIRAKDGYIVLEMLENPAFTEAVNETKFGKLIQGTAYYDYAVSNEFSDDSEEFITKKPSGAKYVCTFIFDGKRISLWADYEDGNYYVTRKEARNSVTYALTKSDMAPNLLMLEKSSRLLKGVSRLYMQGSVYFDSPQTRALFGDILTYLNVR